MKGRRERAAAYAIVVGCGRIGARIAELLSSGGSSVVVIDRDPQAFAELPAEFSGFTLEGDASEIGVLRRAKCSQADLVIAATGNDNLNLFAAQTAGRVLGSRRSMARVDDTGRVGVFEGLGVEIVSPTMASVDLFLAQPASGKEKP